MEVLLKFFLSLDFVLLCLSFYVRAYDSGPSNVNVGGLPSQRNQISWAEIASLCRSCSNKMKKYIKNNEM